MKGYLKEVLADLIEFVSAVSILFVLFVVLVLLVYAEHKYSQQEANYGKETKSKRIGN